MGREEQIEEREVLDSIFPDEITDISEASFRIAIQLDVPTQEDQPSDSPTLQLTTTYSPTYPSTAPSLYLSYHPNTLPHTHLPASYLPTLLSSLDDTISACLETPMLFTLITTLKENAEAHILTRIQEVQNEKEAESRREEEEENRKFEGEKVTREGFLMWRQGFVREMEDERKRREEEEEKEGRGKKDARKEGKRLTGRELWESGLVGKVEGDADEEGEEGGMGFEGLKVGD